MENQEKKSISTLSVLFLGILAVSSASIFIRLSQKEVPSLVVAAFRMTLASIIVAPFCFKAFRKEVIPASKGIKGLLILSGAFLAAHFAVWITSLEYTSVASSVVLVTTAPLWVALLSPIFLKDKLTKWILIGLFVSLAGSVIVGLSSNCEIVGIQLTCNNLGFSLHGREFLGDMMALAGAFLSAGYLIVGRKVREKISLQSYIFSVYSTAAIILVTVVLITGEKVVGYTSASYLWLLLLAIVPQVIGHSSFNWVLKYLPAAYVAIALLGEPIGTIALTMIFLKESPKHLEILGGILILAGITLATQLKKGINIQQKTS